MDDVSKSVEISPEDVLFLKSLGFTEDAPDEQAIKDGALTFYYMEIDNHPYIDELQIAINIEPGFIGVYGKGIDVPFLKKRFTRENILAVMKFLDPPNCSLER